MKLSYITPTKLAVINGISIDVKDVSRDINEEIVNVNILMGENDVQVGATVESNIIIVHNSERITSSSIVRNKEYHSFVESKMTKNYIKITTDMNNILSIGNEISLYALFFDDSLTIRASSFIMNNVLFIFCGQSNSGKTTMLNNTLEMNNEIVPISDDHVMIKKQEGLNICVTPFWDSVYKKNKKRTYFQEACIFFLDPTISVYPSKLDLLPHIIGFGFNKQSNGRIIKLLDDTISKYTLVKGKKKNYEYNINKCYEYLKRSSKNELDDLSNALNSNDIVVLNYYGSSMLPTIPYPAKIIVTKFREIRIGSIYVVEDGISPMKGYFCHRLIDYNGKYIFKGDNRSDIQEIDDEKRIIAEVISWV